MSKRIQVILDDDEALSFRSQARRESKSLSAWLRDAGALALRMQREKGSLNTTEALKKFFQESNQREKGTEEDWEDQKKLILDGYRGNRPS
jgi:hypothetical protein